MKELSHNTHLTTYYPSSVKSSELLLMQPTLISGLREERTTQSQYADELKRDSSFPLRAHTNLAPLLLGFTNVVNTCGVSISTSTEKKSLKRQADQIIS